MWGTNQGFPMYTAPGYNQMSYHQSYEPLPPGSDPQQYNGAGSPSPQHASQSFTSRFYDTNGDDFPKPVSLLGQQQPKDNQASFQSVGLSDTSSFQSAGALPDRRDRVKPSSGSQSSRSSGPSASAYIRDKWARLLVWIGSGMVAVGSLFVVFCAVRAAVSEEFGVFSALAWASWYPSLLAIVIVVGLLALFGVVVAGLGIIAGLKERKPLLRAFNTSAGILGILLLLLALFSWLYVLRAKPYVVRAANLMCQEIDVWQCESDVTAPPSEDAAPPSPATTPAPPGLAPAPAYVASTAAPSPAAPGAPTQRRLSDVYSDDKLYMLKHAEERSVDDFDLDVTSGSFRTPASRRLSPAHAVMTFEQSLNKHKDATGVSGVCQMVDTLCKAPATFDKKTACVCSGQWDYATSPSPTNSSTPPSRRLAESSATDAAPALVDPWQGSVGDYCDAWSSDTQGEWCFVSAQQMCDPGGMEAFLTSTGTQLYRSSGPCSSLVDSRSQFVLDGYQVLVTTLQCGAVLGLLLVASSACGVHLYQSPTKNSKLNLSNAHGDAHSMKVMDEYTLEQRFEDAQREAVRKLNDQTPEDMKFMLYGFYKQAKEGDVRSAPLLNWNSKEKTKYDYWARHRGMSREKAIEGYIKAVALLE